MARIRVLILLLTFVVLAIFGGLVIMYAKGYRFDFGNEDVSFSKKGLLVANSDPNGAQVFLDGELETATNSTITLAPGKHTVVIKKEGFLNWEKEVEVFEEEVTQINAFLLPVAPSLSALTFSGAFNPVLSADQTKIAYGVLLDQEADEDRAGLWVLEMGNLPLGFSRDPRRITDGDLTKATWEFSPDGREILLTKGTQVYLLSSSSFTEEPRLVNVAFREAQIREEWAQLAKEKLEGKLGSLKPQLRDIFKSSVKNIIFSLDESKILYTASASAFIPEGIVEPLPGASTQTQKRDIKSDEVYVYDIKEDRNFLVGKDGGSIYWLQNSLNLLAPGEQSIEILDYDGTNRQTVFSGGFVYPFVYPSTSAGRLIILTNFGAGSVPNNLYWLGLK